MGGLYMFKNYIFDLYGTLVDINTNEDSLILWEKLSLFYSYQEANYSSNELKDKYMQLVNTKLKLNTNTNYPDFNIEEIFKELFKRGFSQVLTLLKIQHKYLEYYQ